MAVDSFSMCHQCVCCGVIPIPPIPIDVVSRLGLLMDVCSFNDPEAPAPVAPEVSPKKQGKLCWYVDVWVFGAISLRGVFKHLTNLLSIYLKLCWKIPGLYLHKTYLHHFHFFEYSLAHKDEFSVVIFCLPWGSGHWDRPQNLLSQSYRQRWWPYHGIPMKRLYTWHLKLTLKGRYPKKDVTTSNNDVSGRITWKPNI